MSNNPYNNPQNPQTPMGQPMGQPAPAQGGGASKILLILGGLFLFGVLFCCGGGYMLINFGMNVVAKDIEMQVRDNPTVREHIGEIQSFETDFGASTAHPDDETFIYTVEGTKGSGEMTVKSVTTDDGGEEIISASLRMSDGQTYELDI